MNYRSIADLNRAIQHWSSQLPADISLVVGVPRSGMLAAMLLSLHRNLPTIDLDGFIEGRVVSAGERGRGVFGSDAFPAGGTILILDDTVSSGREMRRTRERIHAMAPRKDLRLKFGAVFITRESIDLLDYWHEVVAQPRLFEWNIMHHPVLHTSCVDIDGVLCRDPTDEENDDGLRYQEFLRSAQPLIVPTREIGWLVTCRLEKYRPQTEEWLSAHKFRCKELVMMDYPDQAARRATGSHAAFKAEHYRRTKADLFIESSFNQATEIARLSGKPVYCVEHREMIQPRTLVQGIRQPARTTTALLRGLKQSVKGELLRTTLGRKLLQTYRQIHFRSGAP